MVLISLCLAFSKLFLASFPTCLSDKFVVYCLPRLFIGFSASCGMGSPPATIMLSCRTNFLIERLFCLYLPSCSCDQLINALEEPCCAWGSSVVAAHLMAAWYPLCVIRGLSWRQPQTGQGRWCILLQFHIPAVAILLCNLPKWSSCAACWSILSHHHRQLDVSVLALSTSKLYSLAPSVFSLTVLEKQEPYKSVLVRFVGKSFRPRDWSWSCLRNDLFHLRNLGERHQTAKFNRGGCGTEWYGSSLGLVLTLDVLFQLLLVSSFLLFFSPSNCWACLKRSWKIVFSCSFFLPPSSDPLHSLHHFVNLSEVFLQLPEASFLIRCSFTPDLSELMLESK